MGGKRYISVILPLRLQWEPVYGVPEGIPIEKGDRVHVAFAGRKYLGVVEETDTTPTVDESRILTISSVADDLPHITEEELKLWRFVSEYYLCTIGEVYKAAYPSGRVMAEQSQKREAERREARMAAKSKAQEARMSARREEIARLTAKQEALECKLEEKDSWLDGKRAELASAMPGTAKESKLKGMVSRGEERLTALQEERRRILAMQDEKRRLMAAAEEAATQDEPSAQGELSKQDETGAEFSHIEIQLTEAQTKAMEEITDGLHSGHPVLLEGVTGAGKTEIYLSLSKKALLEGRNVLYLVPEIALSRQLESRLKKVFGNDLLTFHSAETLARRQQVASMMGRRRYIVLGTRSALFLPHHDLGLVIVDEEHDTSYKQDSPAPRYQGRDTAVMLAKIHGCGVILGSATPSLESIYNCTTGRYTLVELRERFFGDSTAEVQVIDTIAERRKNGMVGDFSRKLLAHMADTLANGEQMLILRARRAYSPVVQCAECGTMPKCPNCNVTLSYHKDRGRLVCHHCGYSEPFSGRCPDCGGELVPSGAGTQKIEEEVAGLFPDAVVARLDTDTAAKSGKVVEDFSKGLIDILVGTQMITKGFDFEKLSLVAVLQADSLLGQQDFRADEKAFHLLEQLMGRAGRRGGRSLFVIQTSQPSHPVYSAIQGGDAEPMAPAWLEERRKFGYPPFSKIINVILKDTNDRRLDYLALALAKEIASAFGTSPTTLPSPDRDVPSVIGPYPPAIDRINKEGIRHIRIVIARNAALKTNKKRLADVVSDFEVKRKWTGHIAMDVDPA